ncbi:Integrase, catalytic core protein [Phytophthora megakarya]|uniref:Integrase, catalytic core protein n=1 Tax=Phytophthora megakarya TaxID=4795 RepID=A0A225V5C4_9STRA|nr:Integrase, catalytic core protein [Phytophthora megakarya]
MVTGENLIQNKIPFPRNVKEALTGQHSKQWRQALDLEYDSLTDNGTWTLVNLPPVRKALPCHWVLVVKYHANGVVERFKARLVAQGKGNTKILGSIIAMRCTHPWPGLSPSGLYWRLVPYWTATFTKWMSIPHF